MLTEERIEDLEDLEDLEDTVFRALAHRDRRALLRSIGTVERPVGELATATGLAQPIVSQHLKVLRTAGLVDVRVDGNRRLYTVDFDRLNTLRRFLDTFWHTKLDALRRLAEADARSHAESCSEPSPDLRTEA